MTIALFITYSAIALNVISVLVLLFGVVKGIFSFVKNEFSSRKSRLQDIRVELGGYILLSLEILIPADILKTIIEPTYEDLIILGSIVLIRTVLSISLAKEIKSISDERKNIDS
ncbi:sll0939 protein [Yersinia aldovae]|uniref:DUF1622 domain-containing protein n=1 Tax=Yersinia aldovae TaxID=29483 RepID=UPI0005E91817|nr:DUF1622 domain-containing protein [Yersinia aldovae]CNH70102.1 sll0939 protein [Yersinia aldovae]